MEEVVTEDDIVKIAVSAEALRKCVDGREYCVLLNKADIRGKAEAAERIAGKLEEQGVHAVWGSLQKQNYNSICNCIDRTEEKAEVWMNKLQEPQNKGSQAQEKPTFIMLAAGNSRRFGSNKLLYEIGRSADVSAYIAQASKGSVRTRKLRDHSRHPVRRNSFQSTRIRNPGPDQFTPGTWLSSSMQIGLAAAKESAACLFHLYPTSPGSPQRPSSIWCTNFNQNTKAWHAPSINDKTGNPCIFSRKYYQELQEITGDKGGKQIINRHPEDVAYLEIEDAKELVDVDTLYNDGRQ